MPLFRTSGDFYPGFQSQSGSVVCVLLFFTSCVTLADLLVVSMAAKPFDPHTCTHAH